MVKRVRHTVEGAAALRELVERLVPPPPASFSGARMGITTYIKDVLRNGVKFTPRRARGAGAARAGKALQTGRATHRLIEKFCKTGKLPPHYRKDVVSRWTRGFANALAVARLEPLRCELPCSLGQLRTNVDLLAMGVTGDGAPVLACVEFKTTSHTQAAHTASYDAVCQKREVLGGCLGLSNCEREAHRVQANFGVNALKATYPELADLPIRPVVVVATTTGTLCYHSKPIAASHFQLGASLSSVMSKNAAARTKLSKDRTFPVLPGAKAGGAAVRGVLESGGHTKIRPSKKVSALTTMGSLTFSVGICEQWSAFSEAHRRAIEAELKAAAGTRTRPVLVVFDSRRGGWQLRYVP